MVKNNNKIPESTKELFTKHRIFKNNGRTIVKEFKPIIQNINKQEILYLHDIVSKKYGHHFTIDLIKRIPEEHIIYFRGTFEVAEYETLKGTFYFDSDTFEVIFDNFERILKKLEEEKMVELIN